MRSDTACCSGLRLAAAALRLESHSAVVRVADECNARANATDAWLAEAKWRRPKWLQTRHKQLQLQNEARSVSSEPIGTAVESCDCFRGIENLNCVAYAKAAGTPTDARAKQ